MAEFGLERTPTTPSAIADSIEATQRQFQAEIGAFHDLWYRAPHTWGFTSFLTIGVMKCPFDLWVYQMLMAEERPQTVIETGTSIGGSALWFACLMDLLQIEGGRVFTVDIVDELEATHPRVTYLLGDSKDPALAARIWEQTPGPPYLVSLDSSHTYAHVREELEIWGARVPVGSRLVVEDTNIYWKSDGGAMQAMREYLQAHPGEWEQDLLCERYLLTMHPGGWLKRVRPAV